MILAEDGLARRFIQKWKWILQDDLNPEHSQRMNQRANMAIKVGKGGITFLGIKRHRNGTLEFFCGFQYFRYTVFGFRFCNSGNST